MTDEDDVRIVTSAVLSASRLLMAVSAQSLATVEEKITLPQFRLLVLLARHGETKLITLSERLGVNPSTALRMVERLSEAGLVSRTVNPASRREVVIRLTAPGRQIFDEVTAQRREKISAIVAKLSSGQRAALVQALRIFSEAGGELREDESERALASLGWD